MRKKPVPTRKADFIYGEGQEQYWFEEMLLQLGEAAHFARPLMWFDDTLWYMGPDNDEDSADGDLGTDILTFRICNEQEIEAYKAWISNKIIMEES